MLAKTGTDDLESDKARRSGLASRPILSALTLGVVAAAVAFGSLKPSFCRSRAIVGAPVLAAGIGTGARASVPLSVARRAATSLAGTHAPPASLAALADHLDSSVRLRNGAAPGRIDVTADAGTPQEAAAMASEFALAYVAEMNNEAASLRLQRDGAAKRKIEALAAAAQEAHRRLAVLGDSAADPGRARSAAAAAVGAAEARLAELKAILASGTPPLAAQGAMPQSIAALQGDYLDYARKLAKARETLGERHTTIIELRNGLKSAAGALSEEWRRLERVAVLDLREARAREASLATATATPAEAKRRQIAAEIRATAEAADAALSRALADHAVSPVEEGVYAVLVPATRAAVQPHGFGVVARGLLAGLAGLAVAGATLAAARCLRLWGVGLGGLDAVREPLPESGTRAARHSLATAADDRHNGDDPAEALDPDSWAPAAPLLDIALEADLRAIAAGFQDIDPRLGPLPIVLIAANEMVTGTTATTLALAMAAAEAGARVLVVEADREKPELAAFADCGGTPMLVDTLGELRVALPMVDGLPGLYLVPHLEDARRVALGFARNTQVAIVDDVAVRFDLILIDGGRAIDCAEEGLAADACLRVARYASTKGDDRFLATLGTDPESFIGTLTASAFMPRPAAEPAAEENAIWEEAIVEESAIWEEDENETTDVETSEPIRSRLPAIIPAQTAVRIVEPQRSFPPGRVALAPPRRRRAAAR